MNEQQTEPSPEPTEPQVDPNTDAGQSLPPRPQPTAEPQAPPPGGPNAVPGVGGDGAYSTAARDLDPDRNPATDTELPDEAKEPEDTDTEATQGKTVDKPEEESPA